MIKYHWLLVTWLSLFASVSAQADYGSKLPEQAAVLQQLRRANNYFMEKWPDAGKTIVTNRERPANIWTRAVYYEGLMALYTIDADKRYFDYAIQWGEKHHWQPAWAPITRDADNQCCGQTYIDLYRIARNPLYIRSIKDNMDRMLESDRVDDWDWIDALQMAMPVFAKLGVTLRDTRYFDRMYAMYAHAKYREGGNGLYNPEDKLWWRDKDFIPPYTEPNGEDCYWSRGNGWVVAALVRVLDELPDTDPHYDEYLQDLKDMLSALVPLQRADGFWNVSLHDPSHYGGKEATGTALFTYGMAWALNKELVEREVYLPIVAKAWNALVNESLHENGFLGYVQGTGKEPKDGQPVTYTSMPDFEDYGLGCFLLAGTEVYQLSCSPDAAD
ncbi:Rhamnogalacturonyl hydrolase YesR [Parapedobacter composti]|uniref:Rhamnogalacturonyl hydrolase YesR n=1 Tax=Parapedobacter composti TaxID=623281 RepID=A0A1I1E1L3_9SPHI|nr:glycoside hydrolase family 88 protein [Parapedobacter composti]SFB81085.1 Rhamnogalacturonyl hydrolase YesR [Parapedobacter composti]